MANNSQQPSKTNKQKIDAIVYAWAAEHSDNAGKATVIMFSGLSDQDKFIVMFNIVLFSTPIILPFALLIASAKNKPHC